MRAVVVLPGRGGEGPPVTDRHAGPMLWVVDRPLVQHVCEALALRGVGAVDWVYPRAAEAARRLLGGGERWGLQFRHHAAAGKNPYEVAATLTAAWLDRPVLFGHADRLVELAAVRSDPTTTVLYGSRGADDRWAWNGWALLSETDARRFPQQATGFDHLARLLAAGRSAWAEAADGPAPRCLPSYLAATRAALATGGADAHVPASVRVHPTARLVGPVHLGADVEVGPGAVVGPFVAVGPNSVVDRGAVLANAVVLPDTYVGPGLVLDGGLVDRHRVVTTGPDGRPVFHNGAAAGSLTDHRLGRWGAAAGRATSAVIGVVRRLIAGPVRLTERAAPAAVPMLTNDEPAAEPAVVS
ncbi:MAG: hypothetical protein K2X82_18280 [Gemmataceae bacterium]|nr:hypothetical protein [Gemmataceae bacterium]